MSQLDLILAVYRGTIGYLEQAKNAFGQNDLDIGRTACDKARKCLVHLYTTLDMDKGKEIAHHLGSLYAYTIEQLDLAVASKSTKRLNDIIGVLATLKEGWEGLKSNGTDDLAREGSAEKAPVKNKPLNAEESASMARDNHITVSA